MSDLISREALLEEIKENQWGWFSREMMILMLENQPTEEAKEVVHVKWIVGSKPRCSVCGKPALREYGREAWLSYIPSDFCPHCGADMRTSSE